MTPADQKAFLIIALSAAFADGSKDEREREAIRGIADGRQHEPEKKFLAALKRLLALEAGQATRLEPDAEAFLQATEQSVPVSTAAAAVPVAATYALGQVAKRYYAGGRTMSTAMLRDSFQNLLGPAKQMQAEYLPQIRQKASSLDMAQVLAMVKER